MLGELFHAQDPARGDFETNDASATTNTGQYETAVTNARPRTATIETNNTTATEKRTKNTRISPAKVMAVSTPATSERAKATPVSIPRKHAQAQANRFYAKDLRHPHVASNTLPRKLARNSIGPPPQQHAETLKYQRSQFKS